MLIRAISKVQRVFAVVLFISRLALCFNLNYSFTLCLLTLCAVVCPVACNTYVATCKSLKLVDQVLVYVLTRSLLETLCRPELKEPR